jgi:drug/metabolite transporter (DMT)-like permease
MEWRAGMVEFSFYHAILYCSALLTAVSQTFLKEGARRSLISGPGVLNPWILLGYLLLGFALMSNIVGLREVPLKDMAFILPMNYVFVAVLARFAFDEPFNRPTIVGTILIVLGAAVFTL